MLMASVDMQERCVHATKAAIGRNGVLRKEEMLGKEGTWMTERRLPEDILK